MKTSVVLQTVAAVGVIFLQEGAMAKSLDDLKREFFEKTLSFEPVYATFLGVPGSDDKLRTDDDARRDEERVYFTRLLADLDMYPRDLLAAADRIDVDILRTTALSSLLDIEQLYPLGWRSETDISGLVDTVYHNVSRQKGKETEWAAIVSRMRKIPDLLAQQRKNLERGLAEHVPFYRREVERDGIELREEIATYFRTEVVETAKASLSPELFKSLSPKLKDAAEKIDRALGEYVDFLKKEILPKSNDRTFAIGEEEYARRLRQMILSAETPQSLFEYGKKQVEATAREMQTVADEIQRKRGEKSKPYGQVIDTLQEEAPASDEEMMAMYRDLVTRAVSYVREKRLFRLPDDYSIQIIETPAAFTNVLSVAAMNPIPPFLEGVPALFWVTPTRTKANPKGDPALLKLNHCRSAAPNLVVHEAVPGHDLQLGHAARRFIAGGRHDLSFLVRLNTPGVMSSLGVEGWAHYTEELMAEQGFYTPEEHLFQLKDAQWRNVRVVVDVGIHTTRMSYEDAVRYFNEKTMSGDVTAEREIYRYSKWPLQAITYHLGKRDIKEFRDEAKKAAGTKPFDLARFHQLLLDYDGIPVSMYKDALLTEIKTRMKPTRR